MRQYSMVMAGTVCMMMAGCRTATRMTEVPRVDLELSEGNRGYLLGTPPEAGQLKTTRQMVETTVEVPSLYKAKKTGGPVDLGTAPVAPAAGVTESEGAGGRADTYVVQTGDSLWTIAAKPEIYGKATRWRRILEANQELLRGNPDRLRPGMTLKIPRAHGREHGTTFTDEGVSSKK